MLKKIRKRGISEILSYVLLIFIATSVWVFVYVWIKYSANVEPAIDCKEETSINLEKSLCAYEDATGKPMLKLSIFNSGRFNISGIIVAVGTNNKNTPVDYLIPFSKDGKTMTYNAGIYYFEEQLSPGKISDAKFSDILNNGSSMDITRISIVQIQPFIQDKKVRVLCKNAVIKQEIENCEFSV